MWKTTVQDINVFPGKVPYHMLSQSRSGKKTVISLDLINFHEMYLNRLFYLLVTGITHSRLERNNQGKVLLFSNKSK